MIILWITAACFFASGVVFNILYLLSDSVKKYDGLLRPASVLDEKPTLRGYETDVEYYDYSNKVCKTTLRTRRRIINKEGNYLKDTLKQIKYRQIYVVFDGEKVFFPEKKRNLLFIS